LKVRKGPSFEVIRRIKSCCVSICSHAVPRRARVC
jgi:hypothetical protein